jgi:hypothetical protein
MGNRADTSAEFCSIPMVIQQVLCHVDYFLKRSITQIISQKAKGVNRQEYLVSIARSTSENVQQPWHRQADAAMPQPSKVWTILCQPNFHIPRRGRLDIA